MDDKVLKALILLASECVSEEGKRIAPTKYALSVAREVIQEKKDGLIKKYSLPQSEVKP